MCIMLFFFKNFNDQNVTLRDQRTVLFSFYQNVCLYNVFYFYV